MHQQHDLYGRASELEDVAAAGQLERAGMLVPQLRSIATDLLRAVANITLDALDLT